MGPWGALIMGFFGAVFLAAAMILDSGWPNFRLAIPVIIFACIGFDAWRRIKAAAPGTYSPGARVSKIISRASIGEGIGIAVVALGLANTGNQKLVLPGVALVVGLHFLPMAYAIPQPRFFAVAAALILGAIIGFIIPQPGGSVIAGMVAAITLWAAATIALRAHPITI